jgi:hypothetical protein
MRFGRIILGMAMTCNLLGPVVTPAMLDLRGSMVQAEIPPSDVTVPTTSFDGFGRDTAASVAAQLKTEVDKLGRDGVFLVTGTLKPSSSFSYLGTRPLRVNRNGQPVGAIAIYFEATARLKLDAGTGPFTRKIAAVETKQLLRVTLVPVLQQGHLTIEASAEVIVATATKERQAHQSQADHLRDAVRTELTDEFNRRLGATNLAPESVRPLKILASIAVADAQLSIRLGQPGDGPATDAASDKAKEAPSLR